MSGHFRVHKDGINLYIRLTPRAHMDVIEGITTASDGKSYLTARVRAVPEKGKANKALETLIAHHFGLAKSSVTVVAGSTSRMKTVSITGDPQQIKQIINPK